MGPLYITGPTGSGKSSIAATLAHRIGGEVVNADACQLYRNLEIVTAAPTEEQRQLAPHHLYGTLEVSDDCNAAHYAEIAKPVINEIMERGNCPVVVGGSGLYMKSLTHGLDDLPAADPGLREELDALSLPQLVNKLQQVDPDAATQVNLSNRRYVTRAVEISILAGQPMSKIKTSWANSSPDFDGIIITRDREELYSRINIRVSEMIAEGLTEEIRQLPKALSATAARAIGIREIKSYIAGEYTLDQCIDSIRQASRRYAKRQLTWFKKEPGFQMVCLKPAEDTDSVVMRILALHPRPGHA
ncbi:MAG: tRNA (adenosine(37)-N6)-dimethylallyltransferase MiaA [Verrucomicrobiaceae bacterium]|nr:tRNA (adenosine(37)-N6)-dimethylallyltransferase MiaA [Verrucomicrobiaceae bacterium]